MRKILGRSLAVFLFLLSGHAWAANYSNPVQGVFKGFYGDTITVEVPSLVSKSPVTSEDQNGDLSFQLNANTSYRNFNQLTDLKYGDPVSVEYSEDPTGKDKQKVADIITKFEQPVVIAPGSVVNTDSASVPTATQTITTTTTARVN